MIVTGAPRGIGAASARIAARDGFAVCLNAARSIDETRKLNPQLQSFDQWLSKNKDKVMAATQPAPQPTT